MIDIAHEVDPGVVAPTVGTIPQKEVFPLTEIRQKTGCGIGSVFLISGLSMVTALAMAEYFKVLLTPAFGYGLVTGMGLVGAGTSIGYATTFWSKEEVVPKALTKYEKVSLYGTSNPPSGSQTPKAPISGDFKKLKTDDDLPHHNYDTSESCDFEETAIQISDDLKFTRAMLQNIDATDFRAKV